MPLAVATDIGLYLYDAASFTQLHFWATATPVQSVAIAADGHAVAFTPDGAQLVIGAENGVVQLWDAASGLPTETIYPPLGHVDAAIPDAVDKNKTTDIYSRRAAQPRAVRLGANFAFGNCASSQTLRRSHFEHIQPFGHHENTATFERIEECIYLR
ncbi:MAG: hypothetical protein R2867_27165 [Caldilineaceae bacterium]